MENYCNIVTSRYVRAVQLVFCKQFRSRAPKKKSPKGLVAITGWVTGGYASGSFRNPNIWRTFDSVRIRSFGRDDDATAAAAATETATSNRLRGQDAIRAMIIFVIKNNSNNSYNNIKYGACEPNILENNCRAASELQTF